eukprot:275199_1
MTAETNKYEYHNMFLLPNRELAMHGYIRKHSNNTISHDLIPLFVQFYDHAIFWIIKDYDMNIFHECKVNKKMQGPRFSPINGLICSLSVYPQGHNARVTGKATFFLDFHNIAEYIENITITFNFFIDEIKYQCICTKKYNVNCKKNYIFWGYQIPFKNVMECLKTLHISCSLDIIHIEYKELKHFVTVIPPLKDTNFKWRFTDNMLNQLKSDRFYGKHYSDCFYNGCWTLSCKKKNASVLCILGLLKLPFEIKSVTVHYEILACLDEKNFELCGDKCLLYNNDKPSENRTAAKEIFPWKLIHNINELMFSVSIKVIDFE